MLTALSASTISAAETTATETTAEETTAETKETLTAGDYSYYLADDGTSVISATTSTAEAIELPTEIDGKKVTGIGERAFSENSTAKKITIPDTITDINEYAFFGCSALMAISVDTDNTSFTSDDGILYNKDKTQILAYPIGKEATEYTISDSVTKIGSCAFAMSTILQKINIPASVTEISEWAFAYCTQIKSFTLPEGITSIPKYAFVYDNVLESINIPKSVKSIGYGAFGCCVSLKEITLPDGIDDIQDFAFSECSAIKEVNLPTDLKSIGSGAFSSCTALTKATVNGEATTIGEYAFGCSYGENNTLEVQSGFILYGLTGSTADVYAKEVGVQFESIGQAKNPIKAESSLDSNVNSEVESLESGETTVTTVAESTPDSEDKNSSSNVKKIIAVVGISVVVIGAVIGVIVINKKKNK